MPIAPICAHAPTWAEGPAAAQVGGAARGMSKRYRLRNVMLMGPGVVLDRRLGRYGFCLLSGVGPAQS
jgi:hypothetical protein